MLRIKINLCIGVCFILSIISCNLGKKDKNNILTNEYIIVKQLIDSSYLYQEKLILCPSEYSIFWENYFSDKDYCICVLDSLHFFPFRKLTGIREECMSIVLDTGRIRGVYLANKSLKNSTDINQLSVCELNGLNYFFRLLEQEIQNDTSLLVSKLDSLIKNYSNFYIQYTLFDRLPITDSVKKMHLACQLWNSANSAENEMYAKELLRIFSYINNHSSCINETLQFVNKTCDLGNVNSGEEIFTEFYFKNVGGNPVIILAAETSCGCTVASYPKYPIKPKDSDKVLVRFRGATTGISKKTITLKMYGCKPIVLTIKANVQSNTK